MAARRTAQRSSPSGARCKNVYRLIRARLGDDVSDREVARRWGMEWKSFVALKHGRRQMPRVEDLERLATVLDVDASFVFQAARGIPAGEISAALAREHRWRALLDRVTDAIFTVDSHGRLQDFNGRFAALVGRPAKGLLGEPVLDLVAPESAPRLLSVLASVASDGHVTMADVALRDAQGRERIVDLDAVRIVDASGGSIGSQMLARDVTDERRLVRELDDERRLLQTFYDCVPAACILFDRDGTIVTANRNVESVCALTASELVGRHAFDVFGDPGPEGCPVTRSFLTGKVEQQVSCVENRAGRSVYVHRTAGPIVDSGVVHRVIEILVDVSAQIRAGDVRFLALCDPPAIEARREGVERRALPRATTSFPVSYSHRERSAGATITSLGAGGVCLQVHEDGPGIGDEIELEWQLPADDASVRAKGVVVWTRPASPQRAGGIGIKFLGVSPEFAPVVLKRSS